mmetsp:Transcript_13882/g.28411  ORF Transcript_13882/g.28411 Transcript_13882/m.28411 type:complete len:281 (-) Transcript_13882:134-976(-)
MSCEQLLCPQYDPTDGTVTSYCELGVDSGCDCNCFFRSCDSSIQSCYDVTQSTSFPSSPPFPGGGQGCDLLYCAPLDEETQESIARIMSYVGMGFGGLILLCCLCGGCYMYHEYQQSQESSRRKAELSRRMNANANAGLHNAHVSNVPVNFTPENFDSRQGARYVSNAPLSLPGTTVVRVTVPSPYPPSGQVLVQLPSGSQAWVALPPGIAPGSQVDARVPDLQHAPVSSPPVATATPVQVGDVEVAGVLGEGGGGHGEGKGGYNMPSAVPSAPVMKGGY